MADTQHAEYLARINRVIDYIEENLTEDLSLERLAAVACFSPYHFHRVFSAITGETLNAFIRRLRVERAANLLLYNPRESITQVALACGFSGSAAFARGFREYYGMSASQWRTCGHVNVSKCGKRDHKNWQAAAIRTVYIEGHRQQWRIAMLNGLETEVEIRELDDLEVAYIRHIGPYQGDSALFERLWARLLGWAGPRGLLRFPEIRCLSAYHDNERLTDDEKLRVCVCITVPPQIRAEGAVGRMMIPGGRYAVARFELTEEQYAGAWDMMMGEWLPQSGYQCDDRPCLEFYLNDPQEHPAHKHLVEICVPVRL